MQIMILISYVPAIYTACLDKFMVVGHRPTIFLEGNSYKIYRRNKYICIDSGGAHRDLGGKQSMYCVEEDMAVYL